MNRVAFRVFLRAELVTPLKLTKEKQGNILGLAVGSSVFIRDFFLKQLHFFFTARNATKNDTFLGGGGLPFC
jgi:hypothetical protein